MRGHWPQRINQRVAKANHPSLVDNRRGRRLDVLIAPGRAFGFATGARNCAGLRNNALSDACRMAVWMRRCEKKLWNQERMPSTGCTFIHWSASAWVRAE
jgi:hypothetical protein